MATGATLQSMLKILVNADQVSVETDYETGAVTVLADADGYGFEITMRSP